MKRRIVKYLGYADDGKVVTMYYVLILLILLICRDTPLCQWIIANGVIIFPLSIIVLLGTTVVVGFLKETYAYSVTNEEKIIMLLGEILKKLYD